MTFFGQNILLIFVAIGMVSWLDMARIVRGQTPESEAQKSLLRRHKLAVYRRRHCYSPHCAERTRCGGGLCVASGAQHDPL